MSKHNSRMLYEAIVATINRGASDRGFAARGGDNRSLRSLSQVALRPRQQLQRGQGQLEASRQRVKL
jgi:hypothetical protein